MSNLRKYRRRLWRQTFTDGDFKRRPEKSFRLWVDFNVRPPVRVPVKHA